MTLIKRKPYTDSSPSLSDSLCTFNTFIIPATICLIADRGLATSAAVLDNYYIRSPGAIHTTDWIGLYLMLTNRCSSERCCCFCWGDHLTNRLELYPPRFPHCRLALERSVVVWPGSAVSRLFLLLTTLKDTRDDSRSIKKFPVSDVAYRFVRLYRRNM